MLKNKIEIEEIYNIVKIDEENKILKFLNFNGKKCPNNYYPVIENIESLDMYIDPIYCHETKTILDNAEESIRIVEISKEGTKINRLFISKKNNKKKELLHNINLYIEDNFKPIWEIILNENFQESEEFFELNNIKNIKYQIIENIEKCKSFEELEFNFFNDFLLKLSE